VSCPVPPVPGAVNVAPSLCYAPMLYGTANEPTVYGYLLGPQERGMSQPAPVPAQTTPPLSQGMGAGTILIGVAAVAALGGLAYWSYRQRMAAAPRRRR
jgi:hypothetical protein